jgi:hypothetical protein
VGPRAGLDTEARGKILSTLPGIEPRSPGHKAHKVKVKSKAVPLHAWRRLGERRYSSYSFTT